MLCYGLEISEIQETKSRRRLRGPEEPDLYALLLVARVRLDGYEEGETGTSGSLLDKIKIANPRGWRTHVKIVEIWVVQRTESFRTTRPCLILQGSAAQSRR